MTQKRLGTARCIVTLDDKGFIMVKHYDTGEVLIKRKAYDGDWNLIWNALEGYNG